MSPNYMAYWFAAAGFVGLTTGKPNSTVEMVCMVLIGMIAGAATKVDVVAAMIGISIGIDSGLLGIFKVMSG